MPIALSLRNVHTDTGFWRTRIGTKWRLSETFYYCASDIHCERPILVSCGLAPTPLKQTWASFNYHLPKE